MNDKFTIKDTKLKGVKVLTPQRFKDNRGHLTVLYNKKVLHDALGVNFVQDKCTTSHKGVLRGIHFQEKFPQGKLVSVISGKILDVIVDLRKLSPSFGQNFSIILDDKKAKSVYIPPGFGHAFVSLEEKSIILYKTTDYFYPEFDKGIIWNDTDLNINWKIDEYNLDKLIISKRDNILPSFREYFKI